jgi:hypothetical protein
VKIGIGLPNPVPNIPGNVLVDWAQRAEAAGFSGLVTIDRIAYPSHDSLTSLAAAAGATERISLMTNILLAPIYTPALLAKTAASIDREGIRSTWSAEGHSGERWLAALTYFSLGAEAEEASRRYLLDYYRIVGDFANQIAESAHRSVSQVRDTAKGFEDAGFTEFYFEPTAATLDQIDRLAEAVL